MPTHTLIVLAIISAIFGPLTPSSDVPPAVKATTEVAGDEEPPSNPSASARSMWQSADEKEDILWLARLIYSETNIESEMRLVGWVARNRVETGFRGTTYKQVALSKNQFSGLNASDPHYARNIAMGYGETANPTWQRALSIAGEVYTADPDERPFPENVRHFYSPVAVAAPQWADADKLYHSVKTGFGQPARFAFYVDVR